MAQKVLFGVGKKVRIFGYKAYFVTLNKEMQVELIERAEYGV